MQSRPRLPCPSSDAELHPLPRPMGCCEREPGSYWRSCRCWGHPHWTRPYHSETQWPGWRTSGPVLQTLHAPAERERELFHVNTAWNIMRKKTHQCLKCCALTFGGKLRRSPLGRVSSLLSSRTELRFSTHSGSTSPSKMIHWRFCSSPRTLSMILKSKETNILCQLFLKSPI